MKNAKRSALCSILLVALCWGAAAYGQITPSGDADSNTTGPTGNFGTSTLLGQTETVLYSFANSSGGTNPRYVTPVLDTNGNLYGTTNYGGAHGYGTVFKLTPSGTETILHSFDVNGTDGAYPVASLVMYKGNLYGTTVEGGTYNIDGTVFELKHMTTGWTETILHTFGASGDGSQPYCALTLDTTGNLYGTTYYGGAYSYGTVFKLTPSGTETILHSFDVNGRDGANPIAGVVMYMGNLYGTTEYGGAYGYGTVFELTPSGTERILHSFDLNGRDGAYPVAGLVVYRGISTAPPPMAALTAMARCLR